MQRIIDIHTHVFPDPVAAAAIPVLEAAGEGLHACYDGTVSGLVAAMDRTGVAVSVIQPVATRADQVRSINDWVASQASDRIVPFGAMHPQFANPATEMARMAALGLRGFKLHPEHQSFEPHDTALARIWEAAVEHDMIAFFHAGADVIHPGVRGTPESFASLLDTWPDLTVVLAHLGGFRQWKGVAEVLAGRDVWLDTAYTLSHLPDDEFVALVRAHGTDRVLFGSDGPWTDCGIETAHLTNLGMTAEETEAILGGNAERLLGF
ncbi:MAG: amidohydrolase family protein [Actinobacteria bacterium]|nr:amidohydrolase family protein [Actinomycetota bacterium]MCG2807915.1 amidohydrolase family protein [Coriobacteriia bacterium]